MTHISDGSSGIRNVLQSSGNERSRSGCSMVLFGNLHERERLIGKGIFQFPVKIRIVGQANPAAGDRGEISSAIHNRFR